MGKHIFANAAGFLAGLGAVAFAVYALRERSPHRVDQPFPFNHQKHVKAGWKCANCHPFVDRWPFAGLPRVQECVDCHESERPKFPDNKELADATTRLQTLLAQGQELGWIQIHRTQPHVYFSHRRHVETAKLDCKDCHGDVEKMTEPFARPSFPVQETKKMDWCLACHQQKKAATDCLSCHR